MTCLEREAGWGRSSGSLSPCRPPPLPVLSFCVCVFVQVHAHTHADLHAKPPVLRLSFPTGSRWGPWHEDKLGAGPVGLQPQHQTPGPQRAAWLRVGLSHNARQSDIQFRSAHGLEGHGELPAVHTMRLKLLDKHLGRAFKQGPVTRVARCQISLAEPTTGGPEHTACGLPRRGPSV